MTLDSYLASSRTRYIRKVRALQRVTGAMSARDVAAFVLFTPRQSYERAVKCWRVWLQTGKVEGSLANSRRRYIEALPRGTWLRRRKRESMDSWQLRLERVKGLGASKAAFLASLLEPTQRDVPVCVDVWMLRGLGFGEAVARRPRLWDLREAQIKCAALATAAGMPRFAWQWAVWDYWRSAGRNIGQQVMFVNETRLEEDLA